ncbi:MAG: alpha/beta fold hydrolase [Ectothiorhodospiraceae bacterium]|nr:alpha/beta fold hydrolase [Ectothiorhodospiraceae bacterium]MCH8503703.1 alpha/beta fold hydrolase [Ectothiorhodospiraceae bacterium]
MANFVISHGAWGGGWEWASVATRLREQGHRVFTPTLTGLGERIHLRHGGITLSDHISDILAVFTYEDLEDVILCGHSYSGMVVTAVADRIPERIRLLVYLDAFVPEHGQALEALLPEPFMQELRHSAEQRGDGCAPIPEDMHPPVGAVPEQQRTRYIQRLHAQPLRTFSEPVQLSGAVQELPRAYVRCTVVPLPEEDPLGPFAAHARASGWPYRESHTAHDLQLLDPAGTAAILASLEAETSPARRAHTAHA